MDVEHELLEYNLPNAITSILLEPLTKNETKVVANLHVRQGIAQDSINNTTYHKLNIIQEQVDIKDEWLDSCAASGSYLEEQLLCMVCKYETKDEGNFVEHMVTHKEQFDTSTISEDKTSGKCDLVKHMKTDTREKPYSYAISEYKASRKSTLVKHVKTCVGEKSYSCGICHYKTARNGDLVRHIKTHTGERSYSCSICDYKAARKSALVNHMKTHTGEKPFSCSICGY